MHRAVLSSGQGGQGGSSHKAKRMLLDPVVVFEDEEAGVCIEASVHRCPPAMFQELKAVFPAVTTSANTVLKDTSRLLVIPTFQKARCDLLSVGHNAEVEKDRLLNNVRPFFLSLSVCLTFFVLSQLLSFFLSFFLSVCPS